ncbi:hypothetical protein TYM08_P0165 [Marinicellulosiphila megalodicopiae]
MNAQLNDLPQSSALPAFDMPAPVKKTKDDFGVLAIKQDGPGYEINLALDTGDENVSFQMDLPEQSSASKKLAQQDNSQLPKTAITKIKNDELDGFIDPMTSTDSVEKTKVMPNNITSTQQAKIDSAFTGNTPENNVSNPNNSNLNNSSQNNSNPKNNGPSANDYLVSAQTQFYEDNYMGALTDIEQAILQDDTQALSYAIKGSILYKLGNKNAAKIAWQKALKLNPKLSSVELSLQYLVGQ